MQIETLKIFCDLCETRSFSKAARLNHISQSAVSQQIRGLEQRHRRRLFIRGKKIARLTAAGELFYATSKEIVQKYNDLQQRLEELSHCTSGLIRVSTIYSIGLYDLPIALNEFLKRYPQVNVHIEYGRVDKIYEEVLNDLVDLGIVAYPVKRSQIEIVPCYRDRLVCICHPLHPLASVGPFDLSLLAGQDFVAFDRGTPTRRALDRVLRQRKIGVNVIMEFDNVETIKRFVEVNTAVSIVPMMTVKDDTKKRALKVFELDLAELHRPIAVIRRRNRDLPSAVTKFIEVFRTTFDHASLDAVGATPRQP